MADFSNKKIGVFDSGLGGLSVLAEIVKTMPSLKYDYVLDFKNFPYSEKSEKIILDTVLDVCGRFFQVSRFDALVVACNTASTIALESLRESLPCTVIGVVPAIKPAAAITRTNHIMALMTERASKHPYVFELIKSFASNCKVEVVGSSKLVRIAEAKVRGQLVDMDAVLECLGPLIDAPTIDTLVLGCTHFPLLIEEFKACLGGRAINFVDSGQAVARRVFDVLSSIETHSESTKRALSNIGYCHGSIEDLWPNDVSPLVKSLGLNEWNVLD